MASSNTEMVSVLRSILTSRKGPATIRQIKNDYENLVGEKIKENILETLMKNSRNEFMVIEKDGVRMFNSRLKEGSEHIARMIAVQKSVPKKKPTRAQPPRNYSYGQYKPKAPTAYSKFYSEKPRTNQYKPHIRPTRSNYNSNNNNNNYNNNNPQVNNSYYANKSSSTNYYNNKNTNTNPKTDRQQLADSDLRKKLESTKSAPVQKQYQQPRAAAESSVVPQSRTLNQSRPTQQTYTPNAGLTKPSTTTLQNRIAAKQLPELPKIQVNNLTNRLTKNREVNADDLKVAREYEQRNSSTSSTPSSAPLNWDIDSLDDFKKLEYFCKLNNYAPPSYRCIKTKSTDEMVQKKKIEFNGFVTVNNKTYSTYPDIFDSEATAKMIVAKIAVNQIRYEEQLEKFPVDLDIDYEIARKVYSILRNSSNGLFLKAIPEVYRDNYKMSLPEHWYQIMLEQQDKLFVIEKLVYSENNTAQIFYAITDDSNSESGSVTSETDDFGQLRLPELQFPWQEENWNLYIINPVKTDQIYVRLIGPEYSEAMDALLDEIEMSFVQSSPISPTEILIDRIYLCSFNDCWLRAKVIEEVNETEVNCFMVDNGDFELIPRKELYECPAEFLKLPAQSFPVSLYGLEDLVENPNSSQYLEELLHWKSLIGKIVTKKEVFSHTNIINVELYDTSGKEDVNLNELILGKILESNPKPSLNVKGINNVRITHVDDYIYAQLVTSFNYIQGLIRSMIKSEFNKQEHQGLYLENVSYLTRYYLVFDVKRKSWFRGQIISSSADKKTFNMSFVDTGITEKVDIQNIYRLDKLSVALTLYPAQCIKFKLHGVEMTESVKNRLRALLPMNKEAMVKVDSISNGVPQVSLYIYAIVNASNDKMMLKINSHFDIDSEFDTKNGTTNGTSTALSNNGDFDKFDSKLSKSLIKLEQLKLNNNGEFLKVHLSLVSSPQCFVIQLYDNLVPLNEMMAELQLFCQSRRKDVVPLEMVIKGEVYAALNEDDNRWYRASIENISYNIIHVFLVDYGSFKTLSNDKLRMLPDKFRILPKQAMKAKLHGIKPMYGDYSPDDAVSFQNMTKNKTFPGVVKNISTDHFSSEPIYELVLFDNDYKINEILIKENRALSI